MKGFAAVVLLCLVLSADARLKTPRLHPAANTRSPQLTAKKHDDSDISGPVVKLDEGGRQQVETSNTTAAPVEVEEGGLVNLIDQALKKEFNDTNKGQNEVGKSFNATAEKEQVVRISSKEPESPTNGTARSGSKPAEDSSSNLEHVDKSVDRIIDQHDNEFVLSTPNDNIASLTLDPQLIQDLTCVLTAAAACGGVFEAIKQPIINGYLVAGAVVGPGGLKLIKELVQVESMAQLGVSLLLFGLGMELSLSKLKALWGVTIIGGSLQILLSMVITGAVAAFVGAPVLQGVFIGVLLSMSSTSVVVKCLEVTRSMNSAYGQITIGTLILQDCSVGLMFALMPVFKPRTSAAVTSEQTAEANAAIVLMVIKVVLKLMTAVAGSLLFAQTALRVLLRALQRHASRELLQLTLVGYCLGTAWLCGHMGLSEELGAFVAGLMISMANAGIKPEEQIGRHYIESIHNVLTALFLSSIGLIMSPRFLWEHITTLTFATLCVLLLKSLLISGVVYMYHRAWRTSLAVGISMAHIGEFSFVLLSMANQLKILPLQVYMLLLGVTALSLLTTPLVIHLCSQLLREVPPAGLMHMSPSRMWVSASSPSLNVSVASSKAELTSSNEARELLQPGSPKEAASPPASPMIGDQKSTKRTRVQGRTFE